MLMNGVHVNKYWRTLEEKRRAKNYRFHRDHYLCRPSRYSSYKSYEDDFLRCGDRVNLHWWSNPSRPTDERTKNWWKKRDHRNARCYYQRVIPESMMFKDLNDDMGAYEMPHFFFSDLWDFD